jgi:ketosteroid isomerase-like protein
LSSTTECPINPDAASVRMAHVWAIRDGKIAAFQQHVDTAKVHELS